MMTMMMFLVERLRHAHAHQKQTPDVLAGPLGRARNKVIVVCVLPVSVGRSNMNINVEG